MDSVVLDDLLPAVGVDGAVHRVGLLKLLADAHTVRRLDLPVPTMQPAVLRQLLLPVMLDALGVPASREEWAEQFTRGSFTPDEVGALEEYLGPRYGHRFRLFAADEPFAQVRSLRALSGETKPATLLVPNVASGNNVPLFSGLTEDDHLDLSPSQALLWLLHAQCWDTAAIKTGAAGDLQAKAGKTTGNPTGPLGQLGVVVPTGATLYDTLMLNTPILPNGLDPADRPQWAWDERPGTKDRKSPAGPEWSARPAAGLLDLLTFQSRRIRLIPVETEAGTRVREVIVCGGDRLTQTPGTEPHTAWNHTSKPKAGQPHHRPRRHMSGRAAWQGLGALLALEMGRTEDGPYTSSLLRQIGDLRFEQLLEDTYSLNVETFGLEYGNQSAVVENAIADSLPLPVASLVAENRWLREAVLDCVGQADRTGRALDNLFADLRRASGGEPLPRDKGERPSARFLHAADPGMRRLLAGLCTIGDDHERLEQARWAWEVTLHRIADAEADALLSAVPPRAVVGHTVKVNGKGVIFRSGKANGIFRAKLREILPQAKEAAPGTEEAA